MDPIVQEVLESQYGLRIVRRIARGGSAEVFEARSNQSGVSCALKVSLDPIDDDNSAIAKELENLQYLKLLSGHPRIVVLMDVWVIGGYLVTRWELAPDEKARTLKDLLKHYQAEGHRGIPLEPLVRYIAEAAEGIEFLNGQGIYHRDIKPANLLLFWDHVKIGDLGLAKFVGASIGSHSGAGTMGYLPPEAYRGRLTPTVDLYSLAATYVKLRTGREPFGQNPEEILERQRHADPILDGLSRAEAAVVRQALAPNWQERPQQGAVAWSRRLAEAASVASKPAHAAQPQVELLEAQGERPLVQRLATDSLAAQQKSGLQPSGQPLAEADVSEERILLEPSDEPLAESELSEQLKHQFTFPRRESDAPLAEPEASEEPSASEEWLTQLPFTQRDEAEPMAEPEAWPEPIRSAPLPGPMEQAVTFGVSGAIVGGILGAMAGAMVGAMVWIVASRGVGPPGLGALGGGLIGALGGGLLGGISGVGRTFLRTLLTVSVGLLAGSFLGTLGAATLGIQSTMLSIVLVTAVTGAVVWAMVWAILGASLGADAHPTSPLNTLSEQTKS